MASKRGHFFQNQIFVPSLEARWSRRATPLAIIMDSSIHKLIQVRKRKRSKEGLLNEIFNNIIEQETSLAHPKTGLQMNGYTQKLGVPENGCIKKCTSTPRNWVSQKTDASKNVPPHPKMNLLKNQLWLLQVQGSWWRVGLVCFLQICMFVSPIFF